MLKQQPMLDITHSNRYPVPIQVDLFKSHIVQSARENKAQLCELCRLESDAEHFEFIYSLQADN
jgi:hypothetical protein